MCLSFHRRGVLGLCLGGSPFGGLCPGDPLDRDPHTETPWTETPLYGNGREVRILLEFILVEVLLFVCF